MAKLLTVHAGMWAAPFRFDPSTVEGFPIADDPAPSDGETVDIRGIFRCGAEPERWIDRCLWPWSDAWPGPLLLLTGRNAEGEVPGGWAGMWLSHTEAAFLHARVTAVEPSHAPPAGVPIPEMLAGEGLPTLVPGSRPPRRHREPVKPLRVSLTDGKVLDLGEAERIELSCERDFDGDRAVRRDLYRTACGRWILSETVEEIDTPGPSVHFTQITVEKAIERLRAAGIAAPPIAVSGAETHAAARPAQQPPTLTAAHSTEPNASTGPWTAARTKADWIRAMAEAKHEDGGPMVTERRWTDWIKPGGKLGRFLHPDDAVASEQAEGNDRQGLTFRFDVSCPLVPEEMRKPNG